MSKAWATLLSADNYVAGCLVLHRSLRQVGSDYPLIVFATSSLSKEARSKVETKGITVLDIQHFEPQRFHSYGDGFERFRDTWNKLAVFQFDDYARLVLLDSDMLVLKNMDELMQIPLKENQIAASHACACNPRKFSHYPKEWIPPNCPHTHSELEVKGVPRPKPILNPEPINSGLVVLRPSKKLYDQLIHFIETDERVPGFGFPDQDVLAHFFQENVVRLQYIYNALKPLRYVHPSLWKDDEVKNVHFILNKPWVTKLDKDDIDYETHTWWWQAYDMLKEEEGDILAIFNKKK